MKKKPYSYPQFFQQILDSAPDDFSDILNFIDECPPGPILEIGAGTGRTLGLIKTRIHHLLEPDPEMVSIMKGKPSDQLSNIEIINEGFPCVDLASEYYAGIYLVYGTIGEINPICVALGELYRILKPGGIVLISMINPLTFKADPLGIYRSKPFKDSLDLNEVSYTIPLHDLGVGEYQTHFWCRENKHNQHFIVKQYFPLIEQWLFMIREIGFEMCTSHEGLTSSQGFTIKLQKPSMKLSGPKLAIEQVYDAMALKYDEAISKASYGMEPWLAPILDEIVGLHPRIIDLACGTGMVGDLISRKHILFSQLIGYDISEQMVQICINRNIYSFVCRLDLSSGLPGVGGLTTDIITAFGFMEFVPDDRLVLRDLHRVLTIGGELLCTFEYCPSEGDDWVTIVANGQEIKRHRRSINSVKETLASCGFSYIKIDKRPGYRSPTNGLEIEYLFVRAKREFYDPHR